MGWKRLGVAVTTVRTHLTHIFEKTGVHRQAELVSLLLRDEAGDVYRALSAPRFTPAPSGRTPAATLMKFFTSIRSWSVRQIR